ncbi:MAG: type III pantothenate kinase [Burkholderiaceae bacterium]
MTLLVDVGNSAIKWARLSNDGTLTVAHIQLHRDVSALATRLADQWRATLTRGAAVVACNVAGPEVAAGVEEAAQALQLQAVRWLRTQQSFDSGSIALVNGYKNPAQLGADRWHCMLGACAASNAQRTADSFVVVNAGTATTADCVEVSKAEGREARFSGKFIGGVIAPGVRLMLESLARQTARLPAADADRADNASDFPDNTDAAIVSGVLDAQTGLIDRICHRFAARLQTEPRLVLTGGYAEALSARLSRTADIEHNLVLRGLALRAQSDLSKVS